MDPTGKATTGASECSTSQSYGREAPKHLGRVEPGRQHQEAAALVCMCVSRDVCMKAAARLKQAGFEK